MPVVATSRARLLQSFSWKGALAFLLFMVALAAWTWSGVLFTTKTVSFAEHLEYFLSILQRNLMMYFPIYVMVALADAAPVAGTRRRVLLGLALVAGTLLAVQVRCAAMPDQLIYVYGSLRVPYCTAFPTWQTYLDAPNSYLTPLTFSAVVMVLLFGRRRDAELRAALNAAAAAQIESRRQRIESELDAMHARVDPDGLLATLRSIRERYEREPADGEVGMEDLIRGLREAAGRVPTVHSPGTA
jgi:hypothetical protein